METLFLDAWMGGVQSVVTGRLLLFIKGSPVAEALMSDSVQGIH